MNDVRADIKLKFSRLYISFITELFMPNEIYIRLMKNVVDELDDLFL